MTDIEAVRARHSIRKYTTQALEDCVIKALQSEIERLNVLGNLHIQLVTNEPKAFKSFLSYGTFTNVSNYAMIIGRKSPTLQFRAGYYTECLVLFAQKLGLGTCIAGLTYKKVPGQYEIDADEKVLLCVAIGYPAEEGRKHGIKTPQQVSNISESTPIWFERGIDAALLAPTAVNQQKFYFKYIHPVNSEENPGVLAVAGKSLVGYTKIDLGIAMRNFEIGAGIENFQWIDNPLEVN